MKDENRSLTLLGDTLFECLDSPDISIDQVVSKIKETIKESVEYHETRLDRSRDLLRHFSDEDLLKNLDFRTSERYDMCDGFEWTPINSPKSKYYWETDRNR